MFSKVEIQVFFPKQKLLGSSGLIRFNKFGILIEFLFLYQFFVQY